MFSAVSKDSKIKRVALRFTGNYFKAAAQCAKYNVVADRCECALHNYNDLRLARAFPVRPIIAIVDEKPKQIDQMYNGILDYLVDQEGIEDSFDWGASEVIFMNEEKFIELNHQKIDYGVQVCNFIFCGIVCTYEAFVAHSSSLATLRINKRDHLLLCDDISVANPDIGNMVVSACKLAISLRTEVVLHIDSLFDDLASVVGAYTSSTPFSLGPNVLAIFDSDITKIVISSFIACLNEKWILIVQLQSKILVIKSAPNLRTNAKVYAVTNRVPNYAFSSLTAILKINVPVCSSAYLIGSSFMPFASTRFVIEHNATMYVPFLQNKLRFMTFFRIMNRLGALPLEVLVKVAGYMNFGTVNLNDFINPVWKTFTDVDIVKAPNSFFSHRVALAFNSVRVLVPFETDIIRKVASRIKKEASHLSLAPTYDRAFCLKLYTGLSKYEHEFGYEVSDKAEFFQKFDFFGFDQLTNDAEYLPLPERESGSLFPKSTNLVCAYSFDVSISSFILDDYKTHDDRYARYSEWNEPKRNRYGNIRGYNDDDDTSDDESIDGNISDIDYEIYQNRYGNDSDDNPLNLGDGVVDRNTGDID